MISVCMLSVAIFSQTQSSTTNEKSKLESQRKKITEKIKYTKGLIKKTANSKKKTQSELKVITKQISLRKQLIANFTQDIQATNLTINKLNNQISVMENDIASLKEEYADMLYHAYTNKNSYSKLMYIFASEDFQLAYKRLKYMQQYTEVRKQQAESIKLAQDDLKTKISQLEDVKDKNVALIATQKDEEKSLSRDKAAQQETLSDLKKEEKSLRAQQKKHEKERNKLNKAIQAIIIKEIEDARNGNAGFSLTPEGKILSDNFTKNKGSLSWPVSRGVITSSFGRHPHPTLQGIEIDNNGVDISTDPGSPVRSIFKGKVTSVFSIPGAGFNIIVTHGNYKTIYANLGSVSVEEGQEVDLHENLGIVLDQGTETVIHLEVWKVDGKSGVPQNPSSWLKK